MNMSSRSTQAPILYSYMKTGNQIHSGCANSKREHQILVLDIHEFIIMLHKL